MPDPEIIEISYSKNPQGQIGQRPRPLKPGTEFKFTCNDPGELTIEFQGESPLNDGKKVAKGNDTLRTSSKPGTYAFDCILKGSDGQTSRLKGKTGGELEIPPPP